MKLRDVWDVSALLPAPSIGVTVGYEQVSEVVAVVVEGGVDVTREGWWC